ncbi:hypothetical protein [Leptospira kmetyi]|uniref:STAS/SEC14 domain-containing protein n=1 Tax=Leptospira kmetyi TaxID=408139 RepID=A0ABX4NGE4_9LEPT|nr:hypothetical protein [Leptospira kmetyi]PJZ31583.1 hypothetical protein CH378_01960 [Leptospira kmetyi]TGL71807.1 hypothetical protein EHQ67_01460 [Leptospira kmetyi]
METVKITKTEWFPEQKLISTRIGGKVETEDIEIWEKSLMDSLAKIEDNGTFKIFVNLHGFEAADLNAHKRFRTIIPRTLSDYGWKVGYVDLFEESKQMSFQNRRGIRCVAAVHVHQDATKIDSYEEKFGKENEHFYTDPARASEWIESYQITS